MDIEYALRSMPRELREKVKEAIDKYNRTGNREYAELAISILQKFDNDSAVRELVRTLKR